MKIRTKLLVGLAGISLFPPVAAYVSLIGSPRISYALRMNEYEAEQGSMAAQLQSDLEGIGSAVEESLSETYRRQLESKERADAERQRQVANATLRSGIAALSKDLDSLKQSIKRQEQEILAAGEHLSAGDERQTELLKELIEAFPSLNADADQFLKLSDGPYSAEGQFVQGTLEPELREKLGRVAQELAVEAARAASEDRHNIETALRNSYRETILVVGLGLLVAVVFAAVVSRGVIGPLQNLRDAAQQLGRGNMDVRIRVSSGDELGELASSFNMMGDDLKKLLGERSQAQDDLSKAHDQLKFSMGELESRNRQASTLTEMADLLQSCFTLEEASGVIASCARKLIQGFSGALLVFSASRNVLEAVATWGPSSLTERVFSPTDCWALRRGRLHRSESDDGAARCHHFGASDLPSVCTPLMAHGETLGILCLVAEANGSAGTPPLISELNLQLAVSLAEQAALSFANLKLREKLRFQSVRDPLTGLFNRRYLDESLERELPNAVRRQRSVGVIMLDVDHFKRFNDMFGHDAGDTVLRELGDYLAKFIRRGDLACRYGGEEFTLILLESSLEDTRRRAEELRTSFQQLSIKHRDTVLGKVTLSLGVAALPNHGTTAAELLAAADGALLRAKEQGRDRVLAAELSPSRST